MGNVLSLYHCCLYYIVEIELSVVSITTYAVPAPWLDQLYTKVLLYQGLHKKHA